MIARNVRKLGCEPMSFSLRKQRAPVSFGGARPDDTATFAATHLRLSDASARWHGRQSGTLQWSELIECEQTY